MNFKIFPRGKCPPEPPQLDPPSKFIDPPLQCLHSLLSTAKRNAGFAVEMIAKCTKLKVLELAPSFGRLAFSSQSFLNVLNKLTSLQTLSLERVKLSDMVSPP